MKARYVYLGLLVAALVALGGFFFMGRRLGPTAVQSLLCPWGCGTIEADTLLLNKMILANEKVLVLPQETPGYMDNVRQMANEQRWKTTLFGTEDPILQLAPKGGTPTLKEFLPEPVNIRFKLLYGDTWWAQGKFFITFDPAIKKVEDFKGKRISLGLRGQSDFGVYSRLILEEGYGITPANADIRHMPPPAMTQQLLKGETDVALTALGTDPAGKEWLTTDLARQLESLGKPIYYIGVEKDVVQKVNEKFGTTFVPITVPAGTLPKQTETLQTAVARAFKAVHADFPDDVAYHIVMAVAKLAPGLHDLHPNWRTWSPETMMNGLSEENVHPGARRAYVELGWWTKINRGVAVTYPK